MRTASADFTPPTPRGSTFSPTRDGKRLNAQARRVYEVMSDGQWRGLRDIAALTHDPEASISARLRDLERAGYEKDKKHAGNGLWLYRIGPMRASA